MVREANANDLDQVLELYLFLHEERVPEHSGHLMETWHNIIHDENHHLMGVLLYTDFGFVKNGNFMQYKL